MRPPSPREARSRRMGRRQRRSRRRPPSGAPESWEESCAAWRVRPTWSPIRTGRGCGSASASTWT
ncbi:hypothetical protein F5972_20715 [Microbispora cellulosiformans]|uniref:Uncharacterized protein n=1 Tax=Microbispora cellulosiformans TaxID=2614688 RepID=A0A5J5K1R5_9ACTN|nr:hypothetical protein F5972_20715 [Microbispora cellulosiformans]